MGLTSYDAAVLANANCVGYWSLNGNVNDTKGTNHLSADTPGTYVGGIDGDQGMLFDGTTNLITSASAFTLSTTQAITIALWCKIIAFDITKGGPIAMLGTTGTGTGESVLNLNGAIANDPLVVSCTGNIGVNNSDYYNATYLWSTNKLNRWIHLAAVYDFSQAAANETKLYLNGALIAADGKRTASENTGSFLDTKKMSLGGGNSTFSNVTLCKAALFNAALNAGQILSLYQSSQLGLNTKQRGSLKLRNAHKLRIS